MTSVSRPRAPTEPLTSDDPFTLKWMQLPDEEVSHQRRRRRSSLAHLSIIAALVLAAFVPLLPTAAEEGVGPGFPPPEKEAGKHETGQGTECKGTECKDQSDPNDFAQGLERSATGIPQQLVPAALPRSA
jgi:hypothetical protein